MTDLKLERRAIGVAEYATLRKAVGWPELDPAAAGAGLAKSLCSVCVTRGEDLVGCGRVVGDGSLYFYLQDLIVAPLWQGRGVGSMIIADLLSFVDDHAVPGSFVGLMAAEGTGKLYEKFGFSRRARGAPGMFRYYGE